MFSHKSPKEVLSLEGISTVIERIARRLRRLRRLELDFSFGSDRETFGSYDHAAIWPAERFKKKLGFISVVIVYFGPRKFADV